MSLFACLLPSCGSAVDGLTVPARPWLDLARDFSPRVAWMRPGAVLIDVFGLGRLIGEPAEIARELERAIREAGLTGRVAIAPTTTAARLLAMADEGGSDRLRQGYGGPPKRLAEAEDPPYVRAEGRSEDLRYVRRESDVPACGSALYGLTTPALASLPVTLLAALEELSDGMPVRDRARPFETLERWGIATLGQFAALPAAALSSRLGRRGAALQRLARGLDAQPFVPDPGTPRYVERLELEWPIDGLEPLSFVLARLLEPLAAALERADRGAAAVRLDLRLTDRTPHARVLQLPAAMRDPRVLRTLLLLDLESHPPAAAIDEVAIEVDPAPARVTQFSLLERARPSPETISTLMARLGALVGADRCGAAALVDTHRTGAFEMVPFTGELPTANSQFPTANSQLPTPNGQLPTPKLGIGTWELGIGTWELSRAAVLRRRRVPLAVRVRVDAGRPVHVAAARRAVPSGAVVDAAGPWRSSGSWWHDSGVCWDRDEWDVELADRTLCRLFQDRATAIWFLEGTFD